MAFGGFSNNQAGRPMAEINMIPLVDVMLVLLVIFIIAVPMLTHAVKVELPKASSRPEVVKPETIQLAIDAGGTVYWNDEKVDEADWRKRMTQSATKQPQPELRIRADGNVAYHHVAQLMADAASAGLTGIGFVTAPGLQH